MHQIVGRFVPVKASIATGSFTCKKLLFNDDITIIFRNSDTKLAETVCKLPLLKGSFSILSGEAKIKFRAGRKLRPTRGHDQKFPLIQDDFR